jgi:hypothetical protein
LQIALEAQELAYEFEVKYTGVKSEESVVLMRVMLLHPYRVFSIEDERNISTRAKVMLRLQRGMMITHLSLFDS